MSVSSAPVATLVVKPVRRVNHPKWKFRMGRWISIHTWTEDERDFLRLKYKGTVQSLKDLAEGASLSASSIRGQLSRMGLIKLEGRWSKEEQEYLEENFAKLPLTTLSRRLLGQRRSIMIPHEETEAVEEMAYEKPVLEEQEGLAFPEEIWQEFNQGHWCFGCSNCNCN